MRIDRKDGRLDAAGRERPGAAETSVPEHRRAARRASSAGRRCTPVPIARHRRDGDTRWRDARHRCSSRVCWGATSLPSRKVRDRCAVCGAGSWRRHRYQRPQRVAAPLFSGGAGRPRVRDSGRGALTMTDAVRSESRQPGPQREQVMREPGASMLPMRSRPPVPVAVLIVVHMGCGKRSALDGTITAVADRGWRKRALPRPAGDRVPSRTDRNGNVAGNLAWRSREVGDAYRGRDDA